VSRDEATLGRVLWVYRRRLRMAALASALSVASVATSLVVVLLTLSTRPAGEIRLVGAGIFTAAALLASMYWERRWSLARVAQAIEARSPGLDNLVVTAEEVASGKRTPHRVVRSELFSAALERLHTVAPDRVQPLAGRLAIATLTLIAAIVVVTVVPSRPPAQVASRSALRVPSQVVLTRGDLRVSVTPPSYMRLPSESHINASEVRVIEGSRVRLEAAGAGGRVQVMETGREPVSFVETDTRWSHEFTAMRSQVLLVRQLDREGREGIDRLVHLQVNSDRRPVVRVLTPAKDLIFGTPAGQVPIEIEARDDFGLSSMALRYTHMTGSGETFTFKEAEVPLQIARTSDGEWRAHATLTLESLRLADGDALVYRALASDRKPGADPAASESFLIEIGQLAGAAATGFAIPEQRDRQAISQQMVIVKTERLQAERTHLTAEAFAEQSQLLAVEQRMVKAEFVFMTGGEVADEVEEAEHAHELAEGRLENAAQVELLTAIREMSRAEAQLNAADLVRALIFERAALAALQRAFDRRRYLLRALPERARIDPARRLAGDRSTARAAPRPIPSAAMDQDLQRARAVLVDLGEALARPEALDTALAARVLAADSSSERLQQIALRLANARDAAGRLDAAREAHRHLLDVIRTRSAALRRSDIGTDPLAGRFADEVSRLAGQR
jgi:hypothetical protein